MSGLVADTGGVGGCDAPPHGLCLQMGLRCLHEQHALHAIFDVIDSEPPDDVQTAGGHPVLPLRLEGRRAEHADLGSGGPVR